MLPLTLDSRSRYLQLLDEDSQNAGPTFGVAGIAMGLLWSILPCHLGGERTPASRQGRDTEQGQKKANNHIYQQAELFSMNGWMDGNTKWMNE